MANLNITEGQFKSVLQNIQNRYVRIELLNFQYQTVDSLEGVCVSGNLTIDANSDIRRTGSITLVINNSSFNVSSGGKVWLDKYVRVLIGITNLFTNDIEWTNCGIYIIDAPSYQYDNVTNTLTLSLLDLMSKLTGVRNGYLEGIPTILSAGENIRQAIIDTLALGGFTQYVVEEAPAPGVIPNDLEFSQGATVYDLLAGLRDIYPNYEIYFDVNGTFFYKPVPTGNGDPVFVDDTVWGKVVINEQMNVDFQNVKNTIEIYGRMHDPQYFSSETTISGNNISLNIEEVTEYIDDAIYGFTLTDNSGYTNMNLKINSLPSLPITLDDGTTSATIKEEAGEVYYCVQYKGTYWNWLGHLQSYGFAEDTNPESPFNINSTVGVIRLPLYGGEYENIFSDDLAQQRAEYELWLHTNMNNTIQLTCVPIPWLDVNMLVNYTSQANQSNEGTEQYIIKSISFGLSPEESMNINMIRFYPENGN